MACLKVEPDTASGRRAADRRVSSSVAGGSMPSGVPTARTAALRRHRSIGYQRGKGQPGGVAGAASCRSVSNNVERYHVKRVRARNILHPSRRVLR